MSHLNFQLCQQAAGRKTKVWAIVNPAGILGYIHWFAHWRKYTFAPVQGTEWDEECLGEVSEFCRTETQKHKAQKASVTGDWTGPFDQ